MERSSSFPFQLRYTANATARLPGRLEKERPVPSILVSGENAAPGYTRGIPGRNVYFEERADEGIGPQVLEFAGEERDLGGEVHVVAIMGRGAVEGEVSPLAFRRDWLEKGDGIGDGERALGAEVQPVGRGEAGRREALGRDERLDWVFLHSAEGVHAKLGERRHLGRERAKGKDEGDG
jgi:hypothetical protein